MELDQFIEHDHENGIIRNRSVGTRVFLNSSEAWTTMKTKMFQAFGSGAASILFGIGQFYGTEMGHFIGGKLDHPLDIIRYAGELGPAFGWGRITSQFSEDTLVVKVENCCFCYGMKSASKEPVCYEFSGMISGALGGMAKQEIVVKEIRCVAKGDPYCEFRAEFPKGLREALIMRSNSKSD